MGYGGENVQMLLHGLSHVAPENEDKDKKSID